MVRMQACFAFSVVNAVHCANIDRRAGVPPKQ